MLLILVLIAAPPGGLGSCLGALGASGEPVALRTAYSEHCLPLVTDAACRDALGRLAADAESACRGSTPDWASKQLRALRLPSAANRQAAISSLLSELRARSETLSTSQVAAVAGQLLFSPVVVELPPAQPPKPRPVSLRLRLMPDGIAVYGGGALLPCDGERRCATREKLRALLVELKRKPAWANQDGVVLQVDPAVAFREVVELMDLLRAGPDGKPLFPNVTLSTR